MIVVIFNYFVTFCLNNVVQLQLSVIYYPVGQLTSRAGKKSLCCFVNHDKGINIKVIVLLKIKVRGEKT